MLAQKGGNNMKDDKTLKSKEVFNYFFDKAKESGRLGDFTVMKALKLVYFAHAWSLGLQRGPLISEEVQAWQYGAVIPSLYHSLKIYGSSPIRFKITKTDIDILDVIAASDDDLEKKYKRDVIGYDSLVRNEETMELLDTIWNAYGSMSGIQLSEIMHKKGTPWWQIWYEQGGEHRWGAVIPDTLIKDYYMKRLSKKDE